VGAVAQRALEDGSRIVNRRVRGVSLLIEMTPQTWRTPGLLDVAVAAGTAVLVAGASVAVAGTQPLARQLDVFAFLLVVLGSACLAWRKAAPLWALAGVVAAVGCYLVIGYPYGPIQVCLVVLMFDVARQLPVRTSVVACVLAWVAMASAVMFRLLDEVDLPEVVMFVWTTTWLVLPWSLGALVNVWQSAQGRARQDLMDRAALDERIRLAREVHDVAGHALAVIAMQAGVALRVFEVRPDGARDSLTAIRTASTQALGQLRTALDQGLSTSPNGVGVDALPALVESVRACGLPVELDIKPSDLPTDVDAIVYRVVQESLTNVLRHAGKTTAEVRVHQDADELLVLVADRGRWPAGAPVRDGRGLSGMRARVKSVGGTLTAGSREAGGFEVVAKMPVPRDP
jgi:signal transduction histidine kinase